MDKAVDIAVLARAPIPGKAKTRLIPAIGPHAAARLHARMVLRTLQTAKQARLGGEVVLWGTPTISHRFFRKLANSNVTCREQPNGDLGKRMQAALRAGFPRPTLLIGTDCPCLTPGHLRTAADALRHGHDAVFLPVEDGGYALIGLRVQPPPLLFAGLPWGSPRVMEETRRRLEILRFKWAEPATLWDIDTPEDLVRLSELDTSDRQMPSHVPPPGG